MSATRYMMHTHYSSKSTNYIKPSNLTGLSCSPPQQGDYTNHNGGKVGIVTAVYGTGDTETPATRRSEAFNEKPRRKKVWWEEKARASSPPHLPHELATSAKSYRSKPYEPKTFLYKVDYYVPIVNSPDSHASVPTQSLYVRTLFVTRWDILLFQQCFVRGIQWWWSSRVR